MKMSKSIIGIAILLVFVMCFAVACGSKPASEPAPSDQPSGQAAKPEYEFRSGEIFNETYCHTLTQFWFADRVFELTNGKVKIHVFPNAQLGNEKSFLEQMQVGSLEFGKSSAGNATPFMPTLGVFGMPYLVKDLDHMYSMFNSQAGEVLKKEALDNGFVLLAFWDMNVQNYYNTKKPIVTPEDMKGLKMRTRNSPVSLDTARAMGATPEPGAMPELYTSLQTGVFDGGDHDPAITVSFKFHEVAKYYSLTQHTVEPCIFFMSKMIFDKLPKDIQDAIVQAGEESMAFCKEAALKQKNESEEIMKAAGVKFNEADVDSFVKATRSVYEKYKKEFGVELIESIENLAK